MFSEAAFSNAIEHVAKDQRTSTTPVSILNADPRIQAQQLVKL